MKLWPYRILHRSDDDIKTDLQSIMQHFEKMGEQFDMIVFIPNAGVYLKELFCRVYPDIWPINFVSVQRASTVTRSNLVKTVVFHHKWLADIMRHMEVLLRFVKCRFKLAHKRVIHGNVDFEVVNKHILIIDDSVDTGTTFKTIKRLLLDKGARNVTTACISNHLIPDKVPVDFEVYRYALLRTKNSRDYYAE